jgi:hypothetical protein
MKIYDREVLLLVDRGKNTYAVMAAQNTLAVNGYTVMARKHGKVNWRYMKKCNWITQAILRLI